MGVIGRKSNRTIQESRRPLRPFGSWSIARRGVRPTSARNACAKKVPWGLPFSILPPVLPVSKGRFDESPDLGLGLAPPLSEAFAVLEQDKGWNGHDPEGRRRLGIGVDVDLQDPRTTFQVTGHPLEDRRQGFAWTAPRSPEIHQVQALGDGFLELGVSD